eukprot:scaffold1997_cov126-Isochrysis_galbana.AAC.2
MTADAIVKIVGQRVDVCAGAQATCRFDEDPEKSDGAGRDRFQALASDPSAPMSPREDIFSSPGLQKAG